jgi:ABC-type sugar transport system ATPase subunit
VIIEFLRRLCQRTDISLIVIDHNYTHLFELCDRVNVIQEGRVTLDKSLGEISMQELVELMVQSYRRQVDGSRRRNL